MSSTIYVSTNMTVSANGNGIRVFQTRLWVWLLHRYVFHVGHNFKCSINTVMMRKNLTAGELESESWKRGFHHMKCVICVLMCNININVWYNTAPWDFLNKMIDLKVTVKKHHMRKTVIIRYNSNNEERELRCALKRCHECYTSLELQSVWPHMSTWNNVWMW